MGMIAQSDMREDNCLGLMVKSGSKGSMVNILQIMACVGQQNCSGKKKADHQGAHYPAAKMTTRRTSFVKHSYIEGLEPDYTGIIRSQAAGSYRYRGKDQYDGVYTKKTGKSLESVHVSNDKTVVLSRPCHPIHVR